MLIYSFNDALFVDKILLDNINIVQRRCDDHFIIINFWPLVQGDR